MAHLPSFDFPQLAATCLVSHTPRVYTIPCDSPGPQLGSCSYTTAAASMSFDSPEEALREFVYSLNLDLPAPIRSVQPIPPVRIQQLHLIHLDDGRTLLLSSSPPGDVRSLRSERGSVASEVALLSWLNSLSGDPVQAGAHFPETGHRTDTRRARSSCRDAGALVPYIPRVIDTASVFGPAGLKDICLTEPPPGTTIATLKEPLGDCEQKSAYKQAGQLFRRIASYISPTGKFGYAVDVLRDASQLRDAQPRALGANMSHSGFDTWSQAFHLLLESVLRDLEDQRVQIPYDRVRSQFERLRHFLDRVERPSLVVIDAGGSSNLLVTLDPGPANVRVTGLRDWSNCVFGDLLLANVFASNLPAEFNRGLDTAITASDPFATAPIIEDQIHAPVRLALYECYHALCGIAREYHRPRDLESDLELYWRKSLQDSLSKLAGFGCGSKHSGP